MTTCRLLPLLVSACGAASASSIAPRAPAVEVTAAAAEDGGAPRILLRYETVSGCPDLDDFCARVAAASGRDPFTVDADDVVRVVMTRTHAGFTAGLSFRGQLRGMTSWQRTFEPMPACDALTEAIVSTLGQLLQSG